MCQESQCLGEINNLGLSWHEKKKRLMKKKKTSGKRFWCQIKISRWIIKNSLRPGTLPYEVLSESHTLVTVCSAFTLCPGFSTLASYRASSHVRSLSWYQLQACLYTLAHMCLSICLRLWDILFHTPPNLNSVIFLKGYFKLASCNVSLGNFLLCQSSQLEKYRLWHRVA